MTRTCCEKECKITRSYLEGVRDGNVGTGLRTHGKKRKERATEKKVWNSDLGTGQNAPPRKYKAPGTSYLLGEGETKTQKNGNPQRSNPAPAATISLRRVTRTPERPGLVLKSFKNTIER